MFPGACIYPPSPSDEEKKKAEICCWWLEAGETKRRSLIGETWSTLITCRSIIDGFSATSLSFWFVPEVVALLLVGLIHAAMAARFAHRTYAGKVRSMPMTRCCIHGWATREIRTSAEDCADIKVSSAFYSVFQHLHFLGIVHPNISFRNRSDEL